MRLKDIEALAEAKKYDEALTECELLLQSVPEKNIDILRVRAYVYSLAGRYKEALKDREIVAAASETLKDYYLAGNSALSLSEYAIAEQYLSDLLARGHQQGEDWFDSAGLFLLAYVQMQLGKLNLAIDSIDRAISLDPECAMPVPQRPGLLSGLELREHIKRKMGSV
jgi:tetratricopeptide (TPR) repeat protein